MFDVGSRQKMTDMDSQLATTNLPRWSVSFAEFIVIL